MTIKVSLALLLLAAASLLFWSPRHNLVRAQQQGHEQELFERIFGKEIVTFDRGAVARIKTMKPGERLKLDTDGDGKVDTVYFIDDDPKTQPEFRPIVVKAIDQDGDMDRDGDADRDSDLYVADWHGNGTVDAVVEYTDTDHDNGVDEMAIYTYSARNPKLGTDAIQVWWSRDVAHTHQLWDTINYRYQQPECQFRTAFGGDEVFSSYTFDSAKGVWVPGWENPFAFYDEDGDDLAEVAIRFSGSGNRMESMRYSFDADNDTARDNPHDYDFSFSCLSSREAKSGATIPVPPALMERIKLRGGPVEPFLAWQNARKFGESAPWQRVMFTWVENDNNVDSRPNGDPHERWEGVITKGAAQFPQVGGPPVSPFNSRYELDLDNSGKMKLYYSPVDRRFHLLGANSGWLKADYNYDGKVDMEFRYKDASHDGIIDTWEVDIDGDGKADRSFHVEHPPWQIVPLTYKSMTTRYNSALDDALAQNQALIDAMKGVLASAGGDFRQDDVESYFTNDLSNYRKDGGVGEKIRNSREGTRYYQDLIRERYFFRLTKLLTSQPSLLHRVETPYNSGDFFGTAKLLRKHFPASIQDRFGWYGDFTSRFAVDVTNPDSTWRLNEPVVLDIAAIRRNLPDFNPRKFALTDSPRRICNREIASQADDMDGDGKADQVIFLANLRPRETAHYWLYYSPTGERHNNYAPNTAATETWPDASDGLGWESNKVAYGFSGGRMEFLGKNKNALVLKSLVPSENYDFEHEWGMNVLSSGETSGIGGLTIWEDGKALPAFEGAGTKVTTIKRRIVATGPVRATVAVTLTGIGTGQDRYEVQERFSIYANGRYSENHVRIVSTNTSRAIRFGPSFIKMQNDHSFFDAAKGYFGSWGRQNNTVQEIGQGAILPIDMASLHSENNERHIVLQTMSNQELTYYTLGDWRRGRMFPVAPVVTNWEKEVKALAARLHNPVHVTTGKCEKPSASPSVSGRPARSWRASLN
jgi:hypothetical protein